MTLIVHHLNNSRSQRLLWMLEELELPYEIRFYERNKATMLAPPELKKVHPLGKSPVLEDGKLKLVETGVGMVRIDHDRGRHDHQVISLALAAHHLLAETARRPPPASVRYRSPGLLRGTR